MKNWAAVLALLGAALMLTPAGAQTAPGFVLGPEAGWYSYHESGLRIAGPMAGFNGSWTSPAGMWVLPAGIFVRLELNGDVAYVDYSSEFSGRSGGIVDPKGDGRALLGGDLRLGDALVLTPYLGVGYRALYDMEEGHSTTAGAIGYNRLSQYIYVPLGAKLGIRRGDWTITPGVEADYLIQGFQTSYVRDAGFDNNATNLQNNGYGFRGEVQAAIGKISFGPYVRYWKIGQSDYATVFAGGKVAGFLFEPSNDTWEYGLSLSFHF